MVFENGILDYVIECLVTFGRSSEGFRQYGTLVSKGILLFLSGERELTYPPNIDGLVLTEDFHENEVACKVLELYVLVRVVEACRESEPTGDERPFDQAQAKWILMRIYNALYDLYEIGDYLPDSLRKKITDERKKTAKGRMRIDP